MGLVVMLSSRMTDQARKKFCKLDLLLLPIKWKYNGKGSKWILKRTTGYDQDLQVLVKAYIIDLII